MKLNVETLMYKLMEADDATFDYWKSSVDYRQKHGYGVFIRNGATYTDEEQHIIHAQESERETNSAVETFLDIMQFDPDQQDRLKAVYKAVKRWYVKETKWQRCLPSDLADRIERFVIG